MRENKNLLGTSLIANELFFEYATGKVDPSVLERKLESNLLKACLKEAADLFQYSENGISNGWERKVYDKLFSGIQDLLKNAGYTKEYKEEEFINLVLPSISKILGEANKYTENFYRYIFNMGMDWKERKVYTQEEKRAFKDY